MRYITSLCYTFSFFPCGHHLPPPRFFAKYTSRLGAASILPLPDHPQASFPTRSGRLFLSSTSFGILSGSIGTRLLFLPVSASVFLRSIRPLSPPSILLSVHFSGVRSLTGSTDTQAPPCCPVLRRFFPQHDAYFSPPEGQCFAYQPVQPLRRQSSDFLRSLLLI